jgi:hypothetical protein
MVRSLATFLLALSWLAGACRAQDIDLSVRSVAFSADGQWLAAGRGSFESKQGDVTVWNLPRKKVAFTSAGKRGIPSVAVILPVFEDRQNERHRRGGHELLGEFHTGMIHSGAMYVKG